MQHILTRVIIENLTHFKNICENMK